MGEVVITYKVMPDGTEVDLGDLKKKIGSAIDPKSIEEENVAFGLKALMVMKVVSEDSGELDDLEDSLADLDNVKNVEVTDQRRLL